MCFRSLKPSSANFVAKIYVPLIKVFAESHIAATIEINSVTVLIFLIALVITNGPMNVTVCNGTKTEIPCGFSTTISDFISTRPSWRIIKRNNNGSVISNETVSGVDIRRNTTDGLEFQIVLNVNNNANGSYLSVGPVDDTYNNTSYQCIFTINDTIIESDTAGTITVIGRCEIFVCNNIDSFIFLIGLVVELFNSSLYHAFNANDALPQLLELSLVKILH